MKFFSRHKKFKQNFIRGICLSATIFQIVALSAYAANPLIVDFRYYDGAYLCFSQALELSSGNLTLDGRITRYRLYGCPSDSQDVSTYIDLGYINAGSTVYIDGAYPYYRIAVSDFDKYQYNVGSTFRNYTFVPDPEPTPAPTPIPRTGLYAYNAHSTGSYPNASLTGYLDSYVGSSRAKTSDTPYVWAGSHVDALVYGDYNFTDSINIYLYDDNGNVLPDGIYKIDSEMKINCEFINNGSSTPGTFIFLGGYSDIIDSSMDIKYSISSMGVPSDNSYSYNIYISGEASVINGFVGSLNVKHSLTFAFSYYNSDSSYYDQGLPQYPPNQSLGTTTLPFISYSKGQPTVIYSDYNKISDSTSIIDSVDRVNDTLQSQFQQDQEGATHAGNEAGSFITQAKDLENKWAILWYPIHFSNDILSVFVDGTEAASYQYSYGLVTGFEYDDSSGCLEPIIDRTRSARNVNGASITFPAYTLPFLDVQLWDSYTFDLSTIKEQFPVLFNAIYVVTSILELYWFVAFLRDKYEEVFG